MGSALKITEDDFDSEVDVAHALLHTGGVMVYPTDTVYGIGGDASSEDVVERIRKMKGITGKKPLSVMMADFVMVEEYCETGLWEDMILSRYLPGPYTFVLKKRREQDLPVTDSDKLGIRIPESNFCQALCREFDGPIVTTSANRTGKPPAVRLGDVDERILDSADLLIDGGETKYGAASVIIDLVDGKIIRGVGSESILPVELPER